MVFEVTAVPRSFNSMFPEVSTEIKPTIGVVFVPVAKLCPLALDIGSRFSGSFELCYAG